MRLLPHRGYIAIVSLLLFLMAAEAQTPPQNYNPFFVIDGQSQTQGTTASSSGPSAVSPRLPGERSCGSGSLAWGANDYQEVPGIYWAYILSYCHGGLEIALWTDFTPRVFGSPQARLQGREIISSDGSQTAQPDGTRNISGSVEANAKLLYQFSVNPDGEGSAQINGQEFDLRNGTLFLIATRNEEIEIRQVDYNLANVSSRDIELLATRLPAITGFYREFHEDTKQ